MLSFSSMSFARCFEYVFAGGELNPEDGKFLVARSNYVDKYAKRAGCITLTFKDKSRSLMEREFSEFIKDNRFDARKDKLHVSIMSHGAPSGVKLNSSGLIGYNEFLSVIDNALPLGSQVTFTGQSCRPGFNNALHSKQFDNIGSICGVTASSWSNKAIIYNSMSDSARSMEFVPNGMKYWIENSDYRTISNFYYQGAASSIYHLARGSRTTSLWFAKTELVKLGFKDTQRIPLLNFLDGQSEFMNKSFDLDLPKQPLQLLQIRNNQGQKPHYSSYVNMYELFFDLAQIDAPKILAQISHRYSQGALLAAQYDNALNYLADTNNWDNLKKNLKYIHYYRTRPDNTKYLKCDFINSHSGCSKETLEAARRLRNYIAVLKQLDDVYIALKLWKLAPSKFDKFNDYLDCENKTTL